ncbi:MULTISPECIES: OsmC family peroxiredoxin [unclassified Lactococcus]|uniref:OsmC family peroxiredoxin n=1 Tax=unclassified Lactococcus TaxID=2643510 RepID=UPI0011C84C19|nr:MULTISPECIES: OsmC family peroxiredoxin [unclassified Lactococcus]MQW22704.1 OsmC family peroxiredoxin [Lactococcus sp. dk101]TXK44711.1 OsmC family peroxiredoxin [Lactococcus sp. dk310]TXK50605.1 OsmC family peroxiredoxin [Lactococcus sp. dk322]
MANVSTASAHWEDSLEDGFGTISAESSQLFTEAPYNFKARAEHTVSITTPEELLGAAHAACFSMAFSMILGEKGYTAKNIDTRADVTFAVTADGPAITEIHLKNHSEIEGISEAEFQEVALTVKANCPVSKALAGVEKITLEASLN